MGYHTYSVEGFGFSVDEIDTNIPRLRQFLHCAPDFRKEIDKYFLDTQIVNQKLDDYLEYDQDCGSGLAYIIQRVIEEAEDTWITIAENFDGEWFVLLSPAYPWVKQGSTYNALTTEDKARKLLQKYIDILTDSQVSIDYQSVENGG